MPKNKSILSETILRRQMELVGKPELAEYFFSRLNEMKDEEEKMKEVKTDEQSRGGEGTNRLDEEEEDKMEEVKCNDKEKMKEGMYEDDEAPGDDMPMGDEGAEPEMDDEMSGEDADEMDEDGVEALVAAIADAIEQHTGVEVGVEGDDGEGMGDEMPADDMSAEEPPPEGDEEEEPVMEDASQEAARGMPKPGSADHIESGKMPGVTDSSDKVDHAHADHKHKDAPSAESGKHIMKEANLQRLAEAVYQRVVKKIKESKAQEAKRAKILEVKKRLAKRRATRKQRK